MIKHLVKIPFLKRIIPSIYKKYIFNKNFYKKIIVDDVIFDLDLRHLIDRRFFFTNLMKTIFFCLFLKF